MSPINKIAKSGPLMIDNAATTSQCRALADDAVVREAITLNIIAPLLVEISERDGRIAALEAEASEGERRGLERVLHMQAPIDSMCMTYRHDFGLPKGMNSYGISGMTERDREALRVTMHQVWEHAVLHAIRALIPEAPAREGETERLRENLRANFEAFATMYNDVNETIGGMPSLVGLLHLGPEMQHACSALAEAVRSYADQKDSVIASALQYVKGKYDPSDDYDFRVYEELRNASPQDREEQ